MKSKVCNNFNVLSQKEFDLLTHSYQMLMPHAHIVKVSGKLW